MSLDCGFLTHALFSQTVKAPSNTLSSQTTTESCITSPFFLSLTPTASTSFIWPETSVPIQEEQQSAQLSHPPLLLGAGTAPLAKHSLGQSYESHATAASYAAPTTVDCWDSKDFFTALNSISDSFDSLDFQDLLQDAHLNSFNSFNDSEEFCEGFFHSHCFDHDSTQAFSPSTDENDLSDTMSTDTDNQASPDPDALPVLAHSLPISIQDPTRRCAAELSFAQPWSPGCCSSPQAMANSTPLYHSHSHSPLAAVACSPTHVIRSPALAKAARKNTTKTTVASPPIATPTTTSSETERPFACLEAGCGKRYLKATHLRAHTRSHTGERPFACTYPRCKWRFGRQDELVRHARQHTDSRPYVCRVCARPFRRSDHLASHTRLHMAAQASTTDTPDTD